MKQHVTRKDHKTDTMARNAMYLQGRILHIKFLKLHNIGHFTYHQDLRALFYHLKIKLSGTSRRRSVTLLDSHMATAVWVPDPWLKTHAKCMCVHTQDPGRRIEKGLWVAIPSWGETSHFPSHYTHLSLSLHRAHTPWDKNVIIKINK